MTNLRNRKPALLLAFLVFSMGRSSNAQNLRADSEFYGRPSSDTHLLFEFVGQVSNLTPTTSTQYGYFTFVRGVDTPFAGSPASETTARFTFFREMTNVLVVNNGTIRMISREGTTTLYMSPAGGAVFSNPDSFRVGTPIQTSHSHQQVIVDTSTSAFTVVNFETVTATPRFSLDGNDTRIGRVGDVYRTSKQGHLASPTPAGYFSGYSVPITRGADD